MTADTHSNPHQTPRPPTNNITTATQPGQIQTHRFVTLDHLPSHNNPLSTTAQNFLDAAKRLGFPSKHLFAALNTQNRLEHIALLAPQPGRTAMLFLSNPTGPHDIPTLAALIQHAANSSTHNHFNLIQSILPTDETLQQQALTQAGFWHLANLEYLHLTTPRSITPPLPPNGITFKPYHQDLRHLYIDTLDASYINTDDCPELHGLRDTNEVLNGHQATGDFDPNLWTLMLHNEQPIGVALINPVPEANCAELVYIGLHHQHRGKRLGATLLRYALALSAQHNHRRITLAVDDRNHPALRLYKSIGFHRAARKQVLLLQINHHQQQ